MLVPLLTCQVTQDVALINGGKKNENKTRIT